MSTPCVSPEKGEEIPNARIQGLQEVVLMVPVSIRQISWCLGREYCDSGCFSDGIQGPGLVSAVQQACSRTGEI